MQDPRFVPPGDMPARIAAWCAEHDVAVARRSTRHWCAASCEWLAAGIRPALSSRRQRWPAATIRTVHVVGGGVQNPLLCQAIADRAGRPVVAGPVEATALGNVLVQARAAGA